jgi:hypothetical protein
MLQNSCKTFEENMTKYWSGWRESNPRIQLGRVSAAEYRQRPFGPNLLKSSI